MYKIFKITQVKFLGDSVQVVASILTGVCVSHYHDSITAAQDIQDHACLIFWDTLHMVVHSTLKDMSPEPHFSLLTQVSVLVTQMNTLKTISAFAIVIKIYA